MIIPRDTPFAKWLKQLGLRDEEAAELLGLKRQRVAELKRGMSYVPGRGPAEPDLITRFAMAAIQAGLEPDAQIKRHSSDPNADRRALLALTAARAKLKPVAN